MKQTKPQNHSIFRILPPLKRLAFSAFTLLVLASSSISVMAQSWSSTGSLATERRNSEAIKLSSGKVLIIGGLNSSSTALSSCELYDPTTGTWSGTGSMTTARWHTSATLLSDGKVLVAGGLTRINGGHTALAEIYNPATGTWSAAASIPHILAYHKATLLSNGSVLLTGGISTVNAATCRLYNPSTNSWSTTGSMVTGRVAYHTITLLPSNKVLVSGGLNGSSVTESSSEVYDPSTGNWSSTGAMTAARAGHQATLLTTGKVLVTAGSSLSSCELYDPTTGGWSNTGSLTNARTYHTSTLLANGNVLVAGGSNPSILSSCELYNPTAGSWSSTASLTTGRQFHTATLLASGTVLVTGGTASTVLNSSELYGGSSCTNPTVPTLNTSSSTNCGAQSTTLSIATGTLNDATSWQWYSGSCGGTSEGSGTSINVSPNTTTTYYARGEGGCVTPGTCANITITVNQPSSPDVPTLSASSSSICGNQTSTLSITGGSLNGATDWQWYNGSCGGTSVGSGTSITVSPSSTTTYYARGEGGCITLGSCGNTTVSVTGPGVPSGANVYSGDITINTQTQMDAFFNSSNGNKYTKVSGNLTINGNSSADPIISLCNLSSLTEVTGHLLIQQFNRSGNPTDLGQLADLAIAGRLTVITCPSFITISLPGLTDVAGSLVIRNNRFVKTIHADNLATVGGGLFMIARNHRAESISFSQTASSFTLTDATESTSVDIQNNGDSTSNALAMDFSRITDVTKNFTFSKNNNSGVSNFDNIFSGLDYVRGNVVVTNNSHLSKCCLPATGSLYSASTTISGNTGNCADSATAAAYCATLYKKSKTPKTQVKHATQGIEYNLYPNPNSGKFRLDLISKESGTISINVTDLMGRTILTQTQNVAANESISLDMHNATAGQYILKAEINGKVIVKRVQVIK